MTASDGAADDNFGYSVDIDGNYAIVGAYYDDDNGSNSGSAYFSMSLLETNSTNLPLVMGRLMIILE